MTSGTGRVPIEDVYAQVVQFSRESGAQRVILFGSRARGTNRPKSDIDLAVEGCPDFAGPCDRLQNELWCLLKLDVVNLDDDLPADLRGEIRRDGRVLYEKV